ncbi:type II toxin-antitoxin system VapC family toxin [Dolichospermum sp. UHCC 0352]|uniref:type II toxin-antitoxin system VapC family toxin n=1 Tax=Dolichospermum sp. UHCC 0352 TaxID=2590011 RepID=UPI00144850BB|nr:PIN domain-containing protein [Dolichospermum sp. UHCC 0352]MTJ19822.1 type II toxin-antitoxin system VapC family toxin [Dolichospermum sp. UHCC 0352]
MNQEIIVDTSALIAFFVKSETNHQIAKQYTYHNLNHRWIILETVFDETVTWIRSKISSAASIKIGQVLRTEHRYINISDQDDQLIWETFCKYNDKEWSYTDCSILVMANRLSVFEVFAFDEHIRQMAGLGIICVP